jgi:hypothetical protein
MRTEKYEPRFIFVGEHDDAASAAFLGEPFQDAIVVLIFGFAEDLLGYSNADACRFGQLSERCDALCSSRRRRRMAKIHLSVFFSADEEARHLNMKRNREQNQNATPLNSIGST